MKYFVVVRFFDTIGFPSGCYGVLTNERMLVINDSIVAPVNGIPDEQICKAKSFLSRSEATEWVRESSKTWNKTCVVEIITKDQLIKL